MRPRISATSFFCSGGGVAEQAFGVVVLGFEIVADIRIEHRGIAQHLLPVGVLQPGIIVGHRDAVGGEGMRPARRRLARLRDGLCWSSGLGRRLEFFSLYRVSRADCQRLRLRSYMPVTSRSGAIARSRPDAARRPSSRLVARRVVWLGFSRCAQERPYALQFLPVHFPVPAGRAGRLFLAGPARPSGAGDLAGAGVAGLLFRQQLAVRGAAAGARSPSII